MRTFFVVFLPGLALFTISLLFGLTMLYIAYKVVKDIVMPNARLKRQRIGDYDSLVQYANRVQPLLSTLVLNDGGVLQLSNEERETLFKLRNPDSEILKEITQ